MYVLALFGLVVAVKLYYTSSPAVIDRQTLNTNTGHTHKSLVLLFCPLLLLVFAGIDIYDALVYIILLVFHDLASRYIQKSLLNKDLLEEEVTLNKKLERLVTEQTNNLKSANAKLRQKNADLKFINLHDPLTGLHNRAYFLKNLETAIQATSPDEKVALILWNVDNLKGINDTYGHFTGDKILIMHAHRVKDLLADTGILARLGGDEFALVLQGDYPEDEALRIAEMVTHSCKEPFQVSEYTFNVTIGVGIALYPNCATDRSSLLRNADIAMNYAKETKPDSHIATYMDIDTAMNRKYLIGNHLKTLDYNQDLRLHFQPLFRTADRALIGMEALLRWDCPGIGSVSPAEFIPIAEDENLIIPIGNWVIENAVSQIAKWNRAYQTDMRMGINFSPKQFGQASTFDVLSAAIKRHHALFKWIDIEITENVALDFEDNAGNIKRYFKTKQLTVSIDDFGTGYSSLGYLTILSFDRLKIAKPLVDKITTEESCRKIVTSIILLAKSLDLLTIAEGVETQAQFDLLLELGCDQIQGYYLGRPVPADVFETAFLANPAIR